MGTDTPGEYLQAFSDYSSFKKAAPKEILSRPFATGYKEDEATGRNGGSPLAGPTPDKASTAGLEQRGHAVQQAPTSTSQKCPRPTATTHSGFEAKRELIEEYRMLQQGFREGLIDPDGTKSLSDIPSSVRKIQILQRSLLLFVQDAYQKARKKLLPCSGSAKIAVEEAEFLYDAMCEIEEDLEEMQKLESVVFTLRETSTPLVAGNQRIPDVEGDPRVQENEEELLPDCAGSSPPWARGLPLAGQASTMSAIKTLGGDGRRTLKLNEAFWEATVPKDMSYPREALSPGSASCRTTPVLQSVQGEMIERMDESENSSPSKIDRRESGNRDLWRRKRIPRGVACDSLESSGSSSLAGGVPSTTGDPRPCPSWPTRECMLAAMSADGTRIKKECRQFPPSPRVRSSTGRLEAHRVPTHFSRKPGQEMTAKENEDAAFVFKPESHPATYGQVPVWEDGPSKHAESMKAFSPDKENTIDYESIAADLEELVISKRLPLFHRPTTQMRSPLATLATKSTLYREVGCGVESGNTDQDDDIDDDGEINDSGDDNGGDDGDQDGDQEPDSSGRGGGDRGDDGGGGGGGDNGDDGCNERDQNLNPSGSGGSGPGGGGDDDDDDDNDDDDDDDEDVNKKQGSGKGGKKRKRIKKSDDSNSEEDSSDKDDDEMIKKDKVKTDQEVKRTRTDTRLDAATVPFELELVVDTLDMRRIPCRADSTRSGLQQLSERGDGSEEKWARVIGSTSSLGHREETIGDKPLPTLHAATLRESHASSSPASEFPRAQNVSDMESSFNSVQSDNDSEKSAESQSVIIDETIHSEKKTKHPYRPNMELQWEILEEAAMEKHRDMFRSTREDTALERLRDQKPEAAGFPAKGSPKPGKLLSRNVTGGLEMLAAAAAARLLPPPDHEDAVLEPNVSASRTGKPPASCLDEFRPQSQEKNSHQMKLGTATLFLPKGSTLGSRNKARRDLTEAETPQSQENLSRPRSRQPGQSVALNLRQKEGAQHRRDSQPPSSELPSHGRRGKGANQKIDKYFRVVRDSSETGSAKTCGTAAQRSHRTAPVSSPSSSEMPASGGKLSPHGTSLTPTSSGMGAALGEDAASARAALGQARIHVALPGDRTHHHASSSPRSDSSLPSNANTLLQEALAELRQMQSSGGRRMISLLPRPSDRSDAYPDASGQQQRAKPQRKARASTKTTPGKPVSPRLNVEGVRYRKILPKPDESSLTEGSLKATSNVPSHGCVGRPSLTSSIRPLKEPRQGLDSVTGATETTRTRLDSGMLTHKGDKIESDRPEKYWMIPQLDGSADEAEKETGSEKKEQVGKSALPHEERSDKSDAVDVRQKRITASETSSEELSGVEIDQPSKNPTETNVNRPSSKSTEGDESIQAKVRTSRDDAKYAVDMARLRLSGHLALRRVERDSKDDTPPSSRYEVLTEKKDSLEELLSPSFMRGGPFESISAGQVRPLIRKAFGDICAERQCSPSPQSAARNAARLNRRREYTSEEKMTPPQINKFFKLDKMWRETRTESQAKPASPEEGVSVVDRAREMEALQEDGVRVKIHDWVPTPSHPRRPIPSPVVLNSKRRATPEWNEIPTPSRPKTARASRMLTFRRTSRYQPYQTIEQLTLEYFRQAPGGGSLSTNLFSSPTSKVRKSLMDQLDSEASKESSASWTDVEGSDNASSDSSLDERQGDVRVAGGAVFKIPNTELYLNACRSRRRSKSRRSRTDHRNRSRESRFAAAAAPASEPRVASEGRVVPIEVHPSTMQELASKSGPVVDEWSLLTTLHEKPLASSTSPLETEEDIESLATPLPPDTEEEKVTLLSGRQGVRLPSRSEGKSSLPSRMRDWLFVSSRPIVVRDSPDKPRVDSDKGKTSKSKQLKIDSLLPSRSSERGLPEPSKTSPSMPEASLPPAASAKTAPKEEEKSKEDDTAVKASKRPSKSPFKALKKLFSPSRPKRREDAATGDGKKKGANSPEKDKENAPSSSKEKEKEEEPQQKDLTHGVGGLRVVKNPSSSKVSSEPGAKMAFSSRKRLHMTGSSPAKTECKYLKAENSAEEQPSC